jgi:putative transposase
MRRMTAWLRTQGEQGNHQRGQRLLRLMGLAALEQKPRLSPFVGPQQVSPDLLRGVHVERVKQVWSTDITSMRLLHGVVYGVAMLDWGSRSVLAWEVSAPRDSDCCMSALERARVHAQPDMFTADQGAPLTSTACTERRRARGLPLSLDGCGRALDHICVERVWRTVKDEAVYRHDYRSGPEAIRRLGGYCSFYHGERLHQALHDHTPEAVYRQLARGRDGRVPPETS